MPAIGCHVSIAGGIENSPQRAHDFNCDALQIFTANQRQWHSAPITLESQKTFLAELNHYQLNPVVTHDSYLINLASPDPKKLKLSRQAFLAELQRSDFLKIPYIVFHPGSHMGKGDAYGWKMIAESLDWAIESKQDLQATLLLEITAGQGTNVGYRFEHLQRIIAICTYPEKLGICFDTCHAFGAGYDIRTPDSYQDTFQKLGDRVGLERLKVFHLNDTKKPLGSRRDRHANLGEGYLGWQPFFRLINDERFSEHTMLLETPNGVNYYPREIKKLKANIKTHKSGKT